MVDVDDKALAAVCSTVNPVEGAHLAGGDAELGQAREQVGEPDVGEGGVDERRLPRRGSPRARGSSRTPVLGVESEPAPSLRHRASLPQASSIIPSEQAKRPYGQIDGRWLPLAWPTLVGDGAAGLLERVDTDDRGE